MTQNALALCNPALSHQGGIHYDPQGQVRTSILSSYLNIAVPELFAKCADNDLDVGLFSYQLERQLHTPELRDEFDYAPHNTLRLCDLASLEHHRHALDLTQDFGGVAHFLSQHFAQVDTLKIDIGRAEHSLKRFPEAGNIDYFSQDPEQLLLPNKHYDFIYLGQLEELTLDTDQAVKLLANLRASLNDSGVLLLGLPNRERLSKWLSAAQDKPHSITPYQALYSPEQSQVFNLSELQTTVNRTGFDGANIYASFAAPKQISNLFSLAYLSENPNAINHFYRIGSVSCSGLSEYLMYKNLQTEGNNLSRYASRYVCFLSNSQTTANAIYHQDFAHFAGTSRLPTWRTITSKATDQPQVKKHHTYPEHVDNKPQDPLLSQNVAPQAFQVGSLLLDQWLSALSISREDHDQPFANLVSDYYNWLKHIESTHDFKRVGYDLLPFNVVCDAEGNYQIIDPEWQLQVDIDPDFVLFRALFWLAFENRAVMAEFCEHWGLLSIDAFVRHFMNSVCTTNQLDAFIALEERVQAQISHEFSAHSIQKAMHHGFLTETSESIAITKPPHKIASQILWTDANDQFAQATAIHIEWPATQGAQSLAASIELVDANKTWLRVDPIKHAGLFQLTSITLVDERDNEIWALSSSTSIAEAATLRNAVLSNDKNADNPVYIALNDNPFLLFDLSHIEALASVRQVRLEASVVIEPGYDNALTELRALVDQQTQSIVSLGNKGHETRAEINQLNIQLKHSENVRLELQTQLSEMTTLREQNQQLQQMLLRLPSARLKRAVKKLLQKLGLRRSTD